MTTLGDLARQAGVRPVIGREESNSGIASGVAVAHPPVIHEPSPVTAPNGHSLSDPVSGANGLEGKTAERSASAVNLYDRAIREASNPSAYQPSRDKNRSTSTPPESAVYPPLASGQVASSHLEVPSTRITAESPDGSHSAALVDQASPSISPGSDPSPQSQASTSIIPEHYQPRHYRAARPNEVNSSPTYGGVRSPASSAAGVFSTTSSPSYIQHHHHQPLYAYHTQYYAPQYHYPPPVETPQAFLSASIGHEHPESPNMLRMPVSPSHAYQPVYYSTMPGESHYVQTSTGSLPYSRHYQPKAFEDALAYDAREDHAYPSGPSQGPSSYAGDTRRPHREDAHAYPAHDNQQGYHIRSPFYRTYDPGANPSSPSMQQMFSPPFSTSSARTSVDYSGTASVYRSVPFALPAAFSGHASMGHHLRYPTGSTDGSGPQHILSQSVPPSTGYSYPQHSRMLSIPGSQQGGELARGHLAQAKLRDATGVLEPGHNASNTPVERRRQSTVDGKLPKPPAHSPWALWVGNVPSDATHAELWQFFASRPPPGLPEPGSQEERDAKEAESLYPDLPTPDYNTGGIDSVHLISRSNCCFVNMQSKRHLDHAIKVCNGLSLRPGDPRCKSLVCRVRKKEDDNKTGVGAQRGRGIHQAWAAEQARLRRESGGAIDETDGGQLFSPSDGTAVSSAHSATHRTSASTSHSASTSSTTSAFLTKHFPKRYFILKSHTEDDLHLSVERGLWATQTHNEPVLDQAFRTSASVFLIFGANKTGEFFGYAKMAGPIIKEERRLSWTNKSASDGPHLNASETSALGPTKSLGSHQSSSGPLLSPFHGHQVAGSPQPLSDPSGQPEARSKSMDSAPEKHSDYLTVAAHLREHMTEPAISPSPALILETGERRGDSLDPRILAGMQRMDINVLSPASASGVADQLASGSSSKPGVKDQDGVIRKDTALDPEERNARLEVLEDEQSQLNGQSKGAAKPMNSESDSTRPFKVEWVRVQKLPFHKTRHLRNTFNGNREVKISRDGTEVEPTVGAQLLELFWKDPALDFGASVGRA